MPANIEAERAIISAVLRDNAVMSQVGDQIEADDFYMEANRLIFTCLQELSDEGKALDAVTLAESLFKKGALESAGGAAYIGDLIDFVGTTVGVKNYAEIVKEKALLRRMIRAATEIATEGYEDTLDVSEYLDKAERSIFEVLGDNVGGGGIHIKDVLREAVRKLEMLANTEGAVLGLKTGFRDLDDLTLGLHGSDLVIIAARPAMGKTTYVLNMASNVAFENNAAVAVFSLEMPADQLGLRLLAARARIGLKNLRSGIIADNEWPKITKAAAELAQQRIYIDDTPAISLMELRAKTRRLKLEGNCDLIIIDYLQLMRSGKNLTSREQEISEISRGLKALAKELHVPVLALSQLNRGLEQRGDKRPLMSDLRESGAIEQDADSIQFIYRDEVYNPDTEEKAMAEIIIGKQRNGPTGTVKLRFFGQFTRFDNFEADDRGYGSFDG